MSDFPKNAPSIKDAKPRKKTNVKKYPGLGYAPTIEEQLDDVLVDPLQELYDLWEDMSVVPKPDLQDISDMSSVASPVKGDYNHPVTKRKKDIDKLIKSGQGPVDAHQAIHGEVNSGDVKSKGELAATLGRIADDGARGGIKMEPEKGSLLSQETEKEKNLDDVTHDDLRTPMNKEVPDAEQTPADQVAEELEECYNYMDDVKYLQTYGRA